LSPTGISYCGAVLVILTFLVALALPSIVLVTLLLLLVGTLDCADGALARYLGRGSPRGELADAIGGYVILAVLPYITWVMPIWLSPTGISYCGAVLVILTFLVALALPSIVLVTLLLLLVGTLDCADGALARYLGRGSPRGELADAIGGYVILAVLPYITWVM